MANIKLNTNRCKGCGLCVDVCPRGALRMSKDVNKAGHFCVQIEDTDKCTGCGFCFLMCPDVAISITKTSSKDDSKKQKLKGKQPA